MFIQESPGGGFHVNTPAIFSAPSYLGEDDDSLAGRAAQRAPGRRSLASPLAAMAEEEEEEEEEDEDEESEEDEEVAEADAVDCTHSESEDTA